MRRHEYSVLLPFGSRSHAHYAVYDEHGVLTWTYYGRRYYVDPDDAPFPIVDGMPRVGKMLSSAVTPTEAEILLGWPPSGYDGLDNPALDALRERLLESPVVDH